MSVRLPDHLDLIAAAPAGIQKLRGLILELAVRGKLVPQDPNDQPASELLKRIAKKRTRLEAGATRKKIEQTPLFNPREWPFESPIGWEWERFGEIAEIERGGSPRPIKSFLTDDPDGLNWIKIGDTDIGGKYITSTSEKIRREGLTKTRMVYPGDFLLTNSMSFGRPYITQIEGCIHDGWLRISPPNSLDKDYLYTLLSSPFVRKLFVIAAAGAVVMNLNADKVRELPIPLPPLAEQRRIVAKVDELMALCDRLEAEQEDAGAAHARLVTTLLGTLTQSADGADLAANWQRLAGHFDILFTTEASLDSLKQTILQLAVMGKLVPQDPNDEPASELLRRITKERARLEEEGVCKKSKPLQPISLGDLPFELPHGWAWARFPEVGQFGRGKSKHRPRNDPSLFKPGIYPLVQTGEVARADTIVREYHSKYSEVGLSQSKMWPRGTLCITIAANIADSAILGFDACFPDSVVGLVPSQLIGDGRYFLWFMKTARGELLRFAPSTAQKNINLEILESVRIPLPPSTEMSRIVAKVDELLALLDRLKAELADSRARQERLAAALIESALQAA